MEESVPSPAQTSPVQFTSGFHRCWMLQSDEQSQLCASVQSRHEESMNGQMGKWENWRIGETAMRLSRAMKVHAVWCGNEGEKYVCERNEGSRPAERMAFSSNKSE